QALLLSSFPIAADIYRPQPARNRKRKRLEQIHLQPSVRYKQLSQVVTAFRKPCALSMAERLCDDSPMSFREGT
ncbi:hypothetical protein, partial [Herbaspirillum lusitanum]|uniref:hypothetical protein n=1 Tax=Herbaspirillum lusitanum TaxID=213312 RepID=UPI00049493B6